MQTGQRSQNEGKRRARLQCRETGTRLLKDGESGSGAPSRRASECPHDDELAVMTPRVRNEGRAKDSGASGRHGSAGGLTGGEEKTTPDLISDFEHPRFPIFFPGIGSPAHFTIGYIANHPDRPVVRSRLPGRGQPDRLGLRKPKRRRAGRQAGHSCSPQSS